MMILHTCIDHDPRMTSLDFGVKRSKVIFGLKAFYHFRTITPFPYGIQWWYFTCIDHDPRRTSGQKIKGQGHIWTLNFAPFPHNDNSTYFLHTMMIFHTFVHFGVKRSKVKVKFRLQLLHHICTISQLSFDLQ